MSITNDLSRLANNANVIISAISVNSTAITSVNVAGITINSSGYTGDANNAAYLGGQAAAVYVNTAILSGNVSTLQSQITANASAAYSNSVSYTDTAIGTANTAMVANAAAAYSNSVTYTDTKIGTANTAMVANASAAYTNATTFASNASNISSGTVAEARLPYRMNQDVRNSDTVTFANMTLTGNLYVGANVTVVGANNISTIDNMFYLNANANYTNPDIGFTAGYNDGTYHHTGFFRDHSDGRWKVFDNYGPEPDANIYIQTSNTTFHLADFQANSVYVGNTSSNWGVVNTSGIYSTGVVNAASHTVGTAFTANSTLVNAYALVVSTNTATIGTGTYFVSNGNVGISNTSPSNKLSINSSNLDDGIYVGGNARPRIILDSGNVTKTRIWHREGGWYAGGISTNISWPGQYNLDDTSKAGWSMFLDAGSDIYRITRAAAGTNPVTPITLLQINATGEMDVYSTSTGVFTQVANNNWAFIGRSSSNNSSGLWITSTGSGQLSLRDANANLATLDTLNGNIGIGTASPSQKFHVSGTGYASTDFRAPVFYSSSDTYFYCYPSSESRLYGINNYAGYMLFQATNHKRITSNDGGGNWNFRAGNYMDGGSLKYINNGSGNSGAATITFSVDQSDGVIGFYTAPTGTAGATVSYTGSSSFNRYGTWETNGDFRAPIFYDTNNTGYYTDPNSISRMYGVNINYLRGSRQINSVYNSSNTLLATPTGIEFDSGSAFIHFTNGNAIAPYATYRSSGDWPAPYGIGWGNGGESSGIFQRYSSGGSFGEMVFYIGNDGAGSFAFRRGTWEGTTYNASGSNHYDTLLVSIDWSGNLYAMGNITGNFPTLFQSSTQATTSTDRSLGYSTSWTNHLSVTFTTTKRGPIYAGMVLAMTYESAAVQGEAQFVLSGAASKTSQYMAVAQQSDQNRSRGAHSMTWMFGDCPAGSYTLTLQVRNNGSGSTWILNNYLGFDTLYCSYM